MLPMLSDSTIPTHECNVLTMRSSQVVGLGQRRDQPLCVVSSATMTASSFSVTLARICGGKAADKFGLHVLLDPSVVVTRLMTGAPRTKRLIFSAISFQRRSTMPLVHPELCGVAITFGNS